MKKIAMLAAALVMLVAGSFTAVNAEKVTQTGGICCEVPNPCCVDGAACCE